MRPGRIIAPRTNAIGASWVALPSAVACLLACASPACATTWTPFAGPSAVTIAGYPASAEEPFISPDGNYLLFNSSESEPDFSLQYARAITPDSFEYAGPIGGPEVNEPVALSGAPSLDDEGNLYWISNRSYGETLSTVFAGHFSEGQVAGAHEVPGVKAPEFGKIDFDVGASPLGRFLYVALGQFEVFGKGGPPSSAKLVMFERSGDRFIPYRAGESILLNVNATAALVYAAAVTADELEIFFSAASPAEGREPQIYRATRKKPTARFTHVERIAAITGFAEAPSITSDGTTLYYHEKSGEEVRVQTVTRIANPPSVTSVSPRYGPAAGGTLITVKGLNLNGATAVHVGAGAASEVEIVSPEELTARTPPGAVGTVDVTVTTSATTSAVTTKDHFSYKP